jgi:hypothetical protein
VSKSCQKVVKSCQKVTKKLPKVAKKSCKKNGKIEKCKKTKILKRVGKGEGGGGEGDL